MRAVVAAAACAAALLATASADARDLFQVSRADTGGNVASDSSFGGATPDGKRVFFQTDEALVPADANGLNDVYERSAGTTTLVGVPDGGSAGAGSGFVAVSDDGSSIVMASNSPLTADDDDASTDLFVRRGGHTYLVTAPQGVEVLLHLSPAFGCMSDDGSRIWFFSSEQLVASDVDSVSDMYLWHDGVVTKVSNGNGAFGVGGIGGRLCTRDGSKVFFETPEQLAPEDTDSSSDIYEVTGGVTSLVTTTQTATPQDATFQQMSADGAHLYFTTTEPLAPADSDTRRDVYEQDPGGPPRLISTGPQADAIPLDADFQRGSEDGRRVWFTSAEKLVASDTDTFQDIYMWHDGVTTIETQGPVGGNGGPDDIVFSGITPDGGRMWFTTHEKLTADDTDFGADVYERHEGVTRRVSVAATLDSAPYDASFAGGTADGSMVIWQSDGHMTADDTDTSDDLFETSADGTHLVTGGTQNVDAHFDATTADLQHVFFTTSEPLLPFDTDLNRDVYESRATPPPAAVADPAPAGGAPGAGALSPGVPATPTGLISVPRRPAHRRLHTLVQPRGRAMRRWLRSIAPRLRKGIDVHCRGPRSKAACAYLRRLHVDARAVRALRVRRLTITFRA